MKKRHTKYITVQLTVVASKELSDAELASKVRTDVQLLVRNQDYKIEALSANTLTAEEMIERDEHEAALLLAYTYALRGIMDAERYINEDGAQ
jgi:hypothetical protein